MQTRACDKVGSGDRPDVDLQRGVGMAESHEVAQMRAHSFSSRGCMSRNAYCTNSAQETAEQYGKLAEVCLCCGVCETTPGRLQTSGGEVDASGPIPL